MSDSSRGRRTPCVGICSTTYGDLVCRGCKRFAHEIVQWNGFAPQQKQAVWQRLGALRDSATSEVLRIRDRAKLIDACRERGIGTPDVDDAAAGSDGANSVPVPVPPTAGAAGSAIEPMKGASAESLAYRLLLRALTDPNALSEGSIDLTGDAETPIAALKAIDNLFLQRSKAHFEHAYKTPAH